MSKGKKSQPSEPSGSRPNAPQPRKPTDNRTAEAKQALKLADEIHETIEDVADWKREKNAAYFESVETAAKEIAEKVEGAEDATPGQIQALTNMLAGVQKWVD